MDGLLTDPTQRLFDGAGAQPDQTDQDNLNVRLAGIEKRMRTQYTALDGKLTSSSWLHYADADEN